jgi:hypothetical protein
MGRRLKGLISQDKKEIKKFKNKIGKGKTWLK